MRIELLYTIAIDEHGNSVHMTKPKRVLNIFVQNVKMNLS